ncbi:MAG: hypothetical protein ACE5DI_06295 [Candidatus Micrarchaeia archaeon]
MIERANYYLDLSKSSGNTYFASFAVRHFLAGGDRQGSLKTIEFLKSQFNHPLTEWEAVKKHISKVPKILRQWSCSEPLRTFLSEAKAEHDKQSETVQEVEALSQAMESEVEIKERFGKFFGVERNKTDSLEATAADSKVFPAFQKKFREIDLNSENKIYAKLDRLIKQEVSEGSPRSDLEDLRFALLLDGSFLQALALAGLHEKKKK